MDPPMPLLEETMVDIYPTLFIPFPVVFRLSGSAPICAGFEKLMQIQKMLEFREIREFPGLV